MISNSSRSRARRNKRSRLDLQVDEAMSAVAWLKAGGVGDLPPASLAPTSNPSSSETQFRNQLLNSIRSLGRPPPRSDGGSSLLKNCVFSSDGYTISKASPAISVVSDLIDLPNAGNGIPLAKCLSRHDRSLLKKLCSTAVPSSTQEASAFADEAEYIALVRRMVSAGIVKLSSKRPRVVNSIFAVQKKTGRQRLIINAIPVNSAMPEPLHTDLPSPALFGSLSVNPGDSLFCAKYDLSDYYYQLVLLGLPM